MNLVRFVSIPLWLIPSLFSNYSILFTSLSNGASLLIIIVQLVNLIGIPILLYKFTPKIMRLIIRHKILSNLIR